MFKQWMTWLKTRFLHNHTGPGNSHVPEAANDNCFWVSLLGSPPVFEVAQQMRAMRSKYAMSPDLDYERKLRIVDSCNTYLALFEALYVNHDLDEAKALAPKLNQHVPELMHRCPDKALRPAVQSD